MGSDGGSEPHARRILPMIGTCGRVAHPSYFREKAFKAGFYKADGTEADGLTPLQKERKQQSAREPRSRSLAKNSKARRVMHACGFSRNFRQAERFRSLGLRLQ